MDTCLRRFLYLTRPMILGFSPRSIFTCFYFLSDTTTTAGVPVMQMYRQPTGLGQLTRPPLLFCYW